MDTTPVFETPGCSLVTTWHNNVTDVYWFNETSLYYEYDGYTYYESCFYRSYGQEINPYATPPSYIPGSTPTPTPTPINGSCTLKDEDIFVEWNIYIPVPYIGPQNCDIISHAFEKLFAMSLWHCVEENHNTQLWFNTPNLWYDDWGANVDKYLKAHITGLNIDCNTPYLNLNG